MNNKKFIISRFKEDTEWVKKYTDNYIIYNKGEPVDDPKFFNTENLGANQRDIFHYIYSNYNDLPDVMIFLQAYPFDHCREDVFKELIKKDVFTPLEYYEDGSFSPAAKRDFDGGYMEINNSWYIVAMGKYYNRPCAYTSIQQFMSKYFENYVHMPWIRFTPGSQYVVEKKQALNYPPLFWKSLMGELDNKIAIEGHIVERALWHIFQGTFTVRKEFYE